MDSLVEKLRSTRDDYDCEFAWVRFLLDAYGGTGGFAGRVQPSAIAQLGWIAEVYGLGAPSVDVAGQPISYLDQYPREEAAKYMQRQAIAHYQNYVEAIFDLLISYTLKRPATVEDLPPLVETWRRNVTLSGSSYNDLLGQVIARNAGLMGWCPVLVDQMPQEAGISVQEVRERGLRAEPFLAALTPANLRDWYRDENGVLQWVKLRLQYRQHPDPLGEPRQIERFKIYTRADVRGWDVVDDEIIATSEATHPFGQVPLISFQHKPSFEDPVRGVSMVGDAAIAARRLFNLDSEFDEHLRSQVFALLQVPVPPGGEPPKEVIAGTQNAVMVPADSSQPYMFVAPPGSVADTYERRIDATTREIFRRARTKFGSTGAQIQSGVSKQWDFEETNRLLSDFAKHLARGEAELYRLVAGALGVPQDAVDKIRVIAPTDFAVEDLAAELDNAAKALGLGLGATMDMLIKRRLASRLVDNMSTEDAAEVEGELATQRDQALNSHGEEQEIGEVGVDEGQAEDNAHPGNNEAA
jgi:hypothetical protein